VDQSNSIAAANYFIEPGYIFVAAKPTVVSGVLGSCVSICVYDHKRKIGGMNHFQFPCTQDENLATARYGNVAVPTLIRLLVHDGSETKHMEAQIVGGAYNPEISSKNIGQDNVRIAKKILSKEKIRVVSEDVGGEKGRKVVFTTNTNEIAVIKVGKLRKSDWYPYEKDR